jgi:hypothetical protein
MFDVVVLSHRRMWEWRICGPKGKLVMQGWEPTREEAKYKAYRALFLLLSAGF